MATATVKGKRPCPLFLHSTGQWTKKIHGKMRYFGKDQETALQRFEKEWPVLSAGGDPRRPNQATVEDICDDFMKTKLDALEEDRISQRHYTQLYTTCRMIIREYGFAFPVVDLSPESFQKLRRTFAKGCGLHAVALRIRHTRSLFKHAYESELIDKPVRMGPAMALPTAKELRRHKAKRGVHMLDADQIKALLDSARPQVKAAIMLGINCGFGAGDCSELPQDAIDFKKGWLTFPRPKTGVTRRCPLWPETIKALKAAIAARPEAKSEEDGGLVFLTIRGKRWVRDWMTEVNGVAKGHHCDELGDEFKKLMLKATINRSGSFYLLRHTFATIADETGRKTAIDHIMGHIDASVGAGYREWIADEGLEAVAAHVRKWLFPKKGTK